ncbi:Fibrinogen-like protein A,Ryncolin-4,Angiopoietin-related protein 7,Ficolin-1-B,Techylectin-5A,Ficolin-2,Ryncolin-1,Tenascin-R,Fibrinogen-like protein 1,Angiopoietin-1,Fibrinogen C domain-containing protein 1-A,Fibrinogen C domain-containing protein 1-B,Tenascin-N,Ryncolin-3,Tenascin,Fibrinogen C domain-containing protein 1,Ryncolin-2,Microfibril-associated glycoprotein 4,Ficolin-1-A,Ficolin-1,Techylectin-like protein,Angiopoietin-4 [Mytilus coruscus]|uniref:Fibrinogen C-terminal domain-containing protein n=1 Tax=Mytilus coruscus TaxID=42192 RepID=A0A6J8B7Z7_MYTCO|nr:Fibrinogen-like protein A,Ryncolin-4,Angiopoietin-related protein 7,Ficolin-1-B,Techylectin-5A,Ficolin-2,Ryncolin-1,Tenascin-R,Fibrinogen-like protein 1,Angiopoietin-1,Fibrinogen C domain-containing protein 1-A,Fibrinogen C domain-containing protein 1-B,Tenascin-N,Ryncolin-3,Tenascin,Fibrinogen C domain-containing protein 1,Ryncolin-2,Microfibril-associated glycoprotein 4,Ficolin-1-A,Ficolin-1,Techylectin-like protein,Angiopoietin-4 [Mytilus coruscus]
MDNPLYRENFDSEENDGNNTVESITMFDRVFKKETFWTKYRSFLCAVGKKQNDGNVQSRVGANKHEENPIFRVIEEVNKTKEDFMVIHDMRKELTNYLTDIRNTSRKELLILETSFNATMQLLNDIRQKSEQELSTMIETRKQMSELNTELRNRSYAAHLSMIESRNQMSEFRTEMRNRSLNEERVIQQWRNESQKHYQEFRRKSQKDLMSFQNMRYDILKVLAATDMCFRNETFNMTEPTQPTDTSGTMRDCLAWKQNGSLTDGVYSISPDDTTILEVYCDMTTDGGGWIVFQRRYDGSENFLRGWHSYEDGFGDINGEFWIGNKYLHILTQVPTELRIDLMAWDNDKRYAKYSTFVIGDAESKYTLSVDRFSGDAGDGLDYHHGLKFSTFDQDNTKTGTKCAAKNKGAWWYDNCSFSSLNGEYLKTNGRADQNMGINWEKFKGDHYSLKSASMMLRRKT